jgi:hypothetical protein
MASSTDYVVWTRDILDGAVALARLTGFEDDWQLMDGVSLPAGLPAKARFPMDPDYPDDVMLTDNLYNIELLIVASQKLRDLVESADPAKVEYLPVPIVNHKKRAIKEPYFIMHPIEPVDCLVVDACDPTWDSIDKTAITRVKQLVVDAQRIPADRLLFRPKAFPDAILTHRRLADKIDAAGCTGVRWVEIANFPER